MDKTRLYDYNKRLKQRSIRHEYSRQLFCQEFALWWVGPVIERVFLDLRKNSFFGFGACLELLYDFLLCINFDDGAILLVGHELCFLYFLGKQDVLNFEKLINWTETLLLLCFERFYGGLILVHLIALFSFHYRNIFYHLHFCIW